MADFSGLLPEGSTEDDVQVRTAGWPPKELGSERLPTLLLSPLLPVHGCW